MIDTQNEELLSLAQAAREVPSRSGRGVSPATIWRWCSRGCKGIRLESVVCGAIRFTSRAAIAKFFAATDAQANGELPALRTPKERERAITAAEKELESAGA